MCPVSPPLYRKEFIDSLNNPERIWDHAFRYQISESARISFWCWQHYPMKYAWKTLRKRSGLFTCIAESVLDFPLPLVISKME